MLDAAENDSDLQSIFLEKAKRDPVNFVRNWCWTHDPRLADIGVPTKVPFEPWEKQAEFIVWVIAHIKAGENGLGEKSRDWGGTVLCTFIAIWMWLFVPGYVTTFGSRKVDLVDKRGDPDCIFEKTRGTLEALPWWMLPEGWERRGEYDNHLTIVNPENGSVIKGEGGEEMGRGGRSGWYVADEHAKIPKAEATDQAISGNARSVFYLSSVNGYGNLFAKKRHSGDIDVFVMDWKADPRKDQAWYAQQIKKWTLFVVRQEIDRDYGATADEVAIPAEWVEAAVNLELCTEGTKSSGLDVATTGENSNVLVSRSGPVMHHIIEEWNGLNTTATYHRAASKAEKFGSEYLNFDVVGVGAGVQGAHETSEILYSLEVNGVTGGSKASNQWLPDSKKHTAKQRFINLRAEAVWRLRLRFKNTWEALEGVMEHPDEDCISIPNDTELIAQLSIPRIIQTDKGLIRIESKKEMRRRGIKSPDRFDATFLAFFEAPIFKVLIGRP